MVPESFVSYERLASGPAPQRSRPAVLVVYVDVLTHGGKRIGYYAF